MYRLAPDKIDTIDRMPYVIRRVDSTPNPNALKFVLEPSPGAVPRSYRTPPAPGTDPLAEALFALPGVVNLLIHDGWMTVSKSANAAWPELRRAVEAVLAREPSP